MNFKVRIARVFIYPIIAITLLVTPILRRDFIKELAVDYEIQLRFYLEILTPYLENGQIEHAQYLISRTPFSHEILFVTDPQNQVVIGHAPEGFIPDPTAYDPLELEHFPDGWRSVYACTNQKGYTYWELTPFWTLYHSFFTYLLIFFCAAIVSIGVSWCLFKYLLAPKITAFQVSEERMKTELKIANSVQQAMLPTNNDPDVQALLRPAREVGGDLYDFVRDEHSLYFCIGDVSDKGVPSAMTMAITRSFFHQYAEQKMDLQLLVKQLNHVLSTNNKQLIFCTFFLGRIQLDTLQMDYINCGHCAPILRRSCAGMVQNSFLPIETNIVLGIDDQYLFRSNSIQLQANDELLLYTDGVTEAMNEQQQVFSAERLLQLADNTTPQAILNAVEEFRGKAEQNDDITIMAVKIPSLT